MRDDPCFRCRLPDCDERSAHCVVRQLAGSYDRKLRRKEHATIDQTERDAATCLFDFWRLERMAEASEGGRPYRRGKTIYGTREAQQ